MCQVFLGVVWISLVPPVVGVLVYFAWSVMIVTSVPLFRRRRLRKLVGPHCDVRFLLVTSSSVCLALGYLHPVFRFGVFSFAWMGSKVDFVSFGLGVQVYYVHACLLSVLGVYLLRSSFSACWCAPPSRLGCSNGMGGALVSVLQRAEVALGILTSWE